MNILCSCIRASVGKKATTFGPLVVQLHLTHPVPNKTQFATGASTSRKEQRKQKFRNKKDEKRCCIFKCIRSTNNDTKPNCQVKFAWATPPPTHRCQTFPLCRLAQHPNYPRLYDCAVASMSTQRHFSVEPLATTAQDHLIPKPSP